MSVATEKELRRSQAATQKRIREVAGQLEKRYKKQVLFLASDSRFKIRRISTGILMLDRLMGGGVPIGRTVEWYGPLSSAKSLAVWMTIAEAQRRGMACALADTEKSFDPKFAKHLGVDVDSLFMIGDLEKGEEVIDYLEVLIRSGEFGLAAIDSVDALVPKAEMEKSAEENTMGRKGQLTSRMMRKLTAVNNGNCTLILTNQVRDQIGIMYGNPEKPGGGRAIGHYASQRVVFRQGEKIYEEMVVGRKTKKVAIGHAVNLQISKDKTGSKLFSTGEFKYYTRDQRIDVEDQLLSLGLIDGIIEQTGNRYSVFGGPKLTEKAFCRWLASEDEVRDKLRVKVVRNHKPREE
jgi:recombination protein RecA